MTNRVLGTWYTDITMPRIIYSLKFDLERGPSGEIVQLIAPLDPTGQSPHCRPCMPKRRVIDLRIGDYVWYGRRTYLIEGVEAYRENRIAPEQLRTELPTEGYVVRGF